MTRQELLDAIDEKLIELVEKKITGEECRSFIRESLNDYIEVIAGLIDDLQRSMETK